jgi:hypothetical protein
MTMRSALARKTLGLLRAGTYLAIAGSIVALFAVRAAKAEAGRGALAFGHRLLPFVELETEKTGIRINGQSLYISSAVVSGNVDATLDRFEQECDGEASPLADAWPKASRAKAEPTIASRFPRLDVFRREQGDEGVVFCFAHGSGRSFEEAIALFHQTRDLGAFGQLRYAYVTRTSAERVRVVTTWTEGSFRAFARTPSGDTEGTDPEATPRPPASTRILSAAFESAPYGLYAYTSHAAPGEVLGFYETSMREEKWVTIRPPDGHQGDETGRAFEKDGTQVLVSATRDRAGQTVVSIGEVGPQARGNGATLNVARDQRKSGTLCLAECDSWLQGR